jgi:hypothetical protein
MFRSINMKKFFIAFLSLILSLQAITAFAAENTVEITTQDNTKIKIKQLNKDSYNITIDDVESRVDIKRDSDEITTNVFELNSGTKYYFIRNIKENTIYSSLTNKTVSLIDDLDLNDSYLNDSLITGFPELDSLQNSNNVLRTPIGTTRFIGTHYVSTEKIAAAVGIGSGVAPIAIFVLSYFGLFGAVITVMVKALRDAGLVTAGVLLLNYKYVVFDHYQTYSRIRHGETIRYTWIDGYRNVRFI